MDSMMGLCETMHTSLYSVAQSAWDYYSKLVEKLGAFLGKVSAALLKIETVFMAKSGISDLMSAISSASTDVVNLGFDLGAALIKQSNDSGVIRSAIHNAKGMINDKWPQPAASGDFDANSADDRWSPQ